MYLRHLSLVDFRSYPAAELPLRPGVTTLLGLNGQGKTNLVEAVGYLATLDSHRVAQDAPLVRFGAQRAVVRGAVMRHGHEQLIELEIVPGRANRARLNRAPATRPRDVLGALRTVLFAPEDLALVKGDPAERRRFLDDLLVARQPRWAGVRSDYDRIVRQRNALLKSAAPQVRRRGRRSAARRVEPLGTGGVTASPEAAYAGEETATAGGSGVAAVVSAAAAGASGGDLAGHADPAAAALHTLDIWDAQLATVGAQLLYARLRLLRDLGPFLGTAYDEVSASVADARATYRSSLRPDAARAIADGDVPELEVLRAELAVTLAENRAAEFERGVTLAGPHRDDVLLTLGELPAKGYASHGESWSLALALRLAAFQLLRRDLRDDPVLILDDVFAELDAGRRERLAGLVRDAEQVIITAAVAADVPATLVGATCRVVKGEVTGVGEVMHAPKDIADVSTAKAGEAPDDQAGPVTGGEVNANPAGAVARGADEGDGDG